MKRQKVAAGIVSVGLVGIALGYVAGRARAANIPATEPMVYSGALTDAAGAPLSGTRSIQLALWDQATLGASQCASASTSVTLAPGGTFQMTLPDACTAVIHDKSDLWLEVIVDNVPLGRTKLGAVPFAVESDTARNAAGPLGTRIGTIEGRLARDTSGTAQRICSGSTPIGSTNWRVYDANVIALTVDTSGCQFTNRPIYITNLVGENLHYLTNGGSSPYVKDATAKTQFEVYVGYGAPWTPTDANGAKWHIEWIAIGNWWPRARAVGISRGRRRDPNSVARCPANRLEIPSFCRSGAKLACP